MSCSGIIMGDGQDDKMRGLGEVGGRRGKKMKEGGKEERKAGEYA